MRSVQALIALLGVALCCVTVGSEFVKTGGPYFYKSWASYELPVRPVQEIAQDVASSMAVYYVAYFTERGKIKSITKMTHGTEEWRLTYVYDDRGEIGHEEFIDAASKGTPKIHEWKGGKRVPVSDFKLP